MALDFLTADLDAVRAAGRHRRLRTFDSLGPRARLDGKDVVVLCGNSYLGLNQNPRVVEAARLAAAEWGTGSGGSRLISGSTRLHADLENALAQLKGTETATLFGTGFQANLGAIPTIVGPGDLVLSDRLNHASLIDACRLSRARVEVYAHADAHDLERLLHGHRATYRRCLIATDGVFSMDGDLAPLPQLQRLAATYDAAILVDDAHGTGVLGVTGAGTAQHQGVTGIDVQMGTLSKALGSEGGFLAGNTLLREALVNLSRAFIFSTAPAPTSVAAALAAVEVQRDEPALRQRLHRNAKRLRSGLAQLGFAIAESGGQVVPEIPIIPVLLGDEATAMAMMHALEAEGVYVAAIRPPTVPPGQCRLRVTVSAAHTDEDLDYALAAFEAALRQVKPDLRQSQPAVTA